MSVAAPVVSGVWPAVDDTSIELRPTVKIYFAGPGLVDPLSWGARTFALYGPGDVVLETGPGTILNSGLSDAPYPILDGALRRDQIEGTFDIYISGQAQASGVTVSGNLGTVASVVTAIFTPSQPLNKNTEYTAVLVGDDALDYITADRRFPGITSLTSEPAFSGVSPSGTITVVEPYSRTLETSLYDATSGYNDTFTITITSGSGADGKEKWTWEQSSSPGVYSTTSSGTEVHTLRDGLKITMDGKFVAGETFTLDTYIPRPLANTVVWSFNTGDVDSFTTPPTTPDEISLVIDDTADGGLAVSTEASASERLYVVETWPPNLDYDVDARLPYILMKFNKPLQSGVYDVDNVTITDTPLLGIPMPAAPTVRTPSLLETSGYWLKIWL